MDCSTYCNLSLPLSEHEDYIAQEYYNQLKEELDKKRYILRRGQVHDIEDRMTFLTYDRNRFGDKYPTKKDVVKGGKIYKDRDGTK